MPKEKNNLAKLALDNGWISQKEYLQLLEKYKNSQLSLSQLLVNEGILSQTNIQSLLQSHSTSLPQKQNEIQKKFQLLQSGGPPFQFCQYQIQNYLSCGGMGAVYKAKNLKSNEIVAIKILHTQQLHQQAKERFQREIKILTRLSQHPNLVKIKDYGHRNGIDFLVMEYLHGIPLQQAIQQQTWDYLTWIQKLIPLLEAVHSMHKKNIIHRDLKPSNIILTKQQLVLTDFGLGKILGDQNQLSTIMVGTPYYMAPEQTIPKGKHDFRTDIWALGVVLYETLTGKLPFFEKKFSDLFHAIRTKPFPPLKAHNPQFPNLLEYVCQKALAKSPQQRYQSLQEMIHDLKQLKPKSQPNHRK